MIQLKDSAIQVQNKLIELESIQTLIDEGLFQYNKIWAAAGHSRAVFQLTPDELLQMTKGNIICVK